MERLRPPLLSFHQRLDHHRPSRPLSISPYRYLYLFAPLVSIATFILLMANYVTVYYMFILAVNASCVARPRQSGVVRTAFVVVGSLQIPLRRDHAPFVSGRNACRSSSSSWSSCRRSSPSAASCPSHDHFQTYCRLIYIIWQLVVIHVPSSSIPSHSSRKRRTCTRNGYRRRTGILLVSLLS